MTGLRRGGDSEGGHRMWKRTGECVVYQRREGTGCGRGRVSVWCIRGGRAQDVEEDG